MGSAASQLRATSAAAPASTEQTQAEPAATPRKAEDEACGEQAQTQAEIPADLDLNVAGASLKEQPEWTAAGWLGSIGLLDQMGAALTPAIAGNGKHRNQLQALLSLVPEGDVAHTRAVLEKRVRERMLNGASGFVSELVDSLLQLQAESASGADESSGEEGKFAMGEASFELQYASLNDFHNGLEGMIGTPSVHFIEAMETEHTREHALNAEFTTGNYGITTTPKTEWLFVAGASHQIEEHLIAIGAWPAETRGLSVDNQHRRAHVPLSEFADITATLNTKLKEMSEPQLLKAEVAGARLYTGPMFVKYNGVLRNSPANGDFVYVTTLHAINSCVIKLSKLTTATKVYRGVVGGSLPPSFLELNAQGVKGGVERAFMSTTTDRDVAMAYATSKPGQAAMVFEIQQGMIDRGADLSHFSQYAHEREILFAPYTGVELLKGKIDKRMLLAESRFSVNLKSLTLEQSFAKRLKLLKEMGADMELEVRQTLRILLEADNYNRLAKMSSLLEPALQGYKLWLQSLLGGAADAYNDDAFFLRTVGEMIKPKKALAQDWSVILSFVAETLPPQQLQDTIGAEFCITLLGKKSDMELLLSFDESMSRPVLLCIAGVPDEDDGTDLELPDTGLETCEWQQRAGATAVLAKLKLSTKELQRLVRLVEILFVLLGGTPDARRAAMVLLQKLQPMIPPLSKEQSETALKVLKDIRGKFKLLSAAKSERSMLSQLLAPRVAESVELGIRPSQLREAGFDLEWLGAAGCTLASLCGGEESVEKSCTALLSEGYPKAELCAVGWRVFVGTLEEGLTSVVSVCVTPDGEYAVTGAGDGTARVRRLADGKHVRAHHHRHCASACTRWPRVWPMMWTWALPPAWV